MANVRSLFDDDAGHRCGCESTW